MLWKVLVIWVDGDEEFVAGHDGSDAIFTTRTVAEEVAAGFRAGIDPTEIQSINVIKATRV